MSFRYFHPKNGIFPARMDYEKGIQYHVFMLSDGFSVARSPILLKMLTDRSCWWQGLVLGHWMLFHPIGEVENWHWLEKNNMILLFPTPTSLFQSCTRICSHPPWGWPFVQGVAFSFRKRHLQLCELESQKIIDAKVSKGRSSVGLEASIMVSNSFRNDALVISALWHRPSVSPGSE